MPNRKMIAPTPKNAWLVNSISGNGFVHLYTLDSSLKGRAILVASSNNKAVENIRRELPAANAVGRTLSELSYFRSASDLMHGHRRPNNHQKIRSVAVWCG
jgi:hypothetical protein